MKRRRSPWWRRGQGALCVGLVVSLGGCGLPPVSVPKTSDRYEFEVGRVALAAKHYLDAQTHLKRFMDTHPGHALADSAQFLLARAQYQSRSYAEAAVEFSLLVREFPRSDLRDDAAVEECLCYFAQMRKPELDATFALRARDCLNDFLLRYPDSPHAEPARQRLVDIADRLAEKEHRLGVMFTKRKLYDAGLIYFDQVVREFPNSRWLPESLLWRARCLDKLGRPDEAEATYQRLLTDFPDHPAAAEARQTRPPAPAPPAPESP